jgi:hypothetical protein
LDGEAEDPFVVDAAVGDHEKSPDAINAQVE